MSCDDKNFRSFVFSDDLYLGHGSFGDVYGPYDFKGKKCAIKRLRIATGDAEKDTEKQISAFDQWKSLHHTSLIKVYEISLEPHAIYMVMEYAFGGSLKKVLHRCKSDLSLEILIDWGLQIAGGMAYLHENKIVHRDLKSENIVVMEANASSNPYKKTLKITDFDQIREHHGTNVMTFAGTCNWAAPEVLLEHQFSKVSDVWSYGVVLWEILTRSVPYKGAPSNIIILKALKDELTLEIPDTCPGIIKPILNRCLSKDRVERPKFDEIFLEFQSFRDRVTSCSNNFSRFASDCLFLGKGAYGEVYGPLLWDGKECAIKRQMTGYDDDKELLSACRMMMHLHHKHLISVYEVSLEPPAVYTMMEFAGGGSLRAVLSACPSDLPLEILEDWGIQIAKGMRFLHENSILHRNLKSQNILVMEAGASSNPYNKTLKIEGSDVIRESEDTRTMSIAGTVAYMAPEVLLEEKFSKASDVWSYGVVLWEILTRSVPHNGVAHLTILVKALKDELTLEIPDTCPDIIKAILNRCLSKERVKRPKFDEIFLEFQSFLEGTLGL